MNQQTTDNSYDNTLKQALQELQETKDQLEALQTTLLHEMKQKYVYQAVATNKYRELQDKKERLLHKGMNADDKEALQSIIDVQASIIIHMVFAGAYRAFEDLPETMQECSYIINENPTVFDFMD
jgi:hypothetical protein